MGIKSKKWYENQIKALENAAYNTGKLMYQPIQYEFDSDKYYKEMEMTMKLNSPVQAECKKIYEQLNQLKHECNLYYRGQT